MNIGMAFLRVGVVLVAASAFAQPASSRVDIAMGLGGGPAGGNARTDSPVERKAGVSVSLNAAYVFARLKGTSVAIETPVVWGGSVRSDVIVGGRWAEYYSEKLRAVFTPGVRLRFLPDGRFSPWIAFGAGVASLWRSGESFVFGPPIAKQVDINLAFVTAAGAGIDVGLGKRWLVRGEFRNYLYRTPGSGFVGVWTFIHRWNSNPVVLAGVGLRL